MTENKETGLALMNADKVVEIAKPIKELVVTHKLFTEIQGKRFVWVEGWCVAGNRLGLTALPKTPVKLPGQQNVTVELPEKYGKKPDPVLISNEVIYGCECDIIRVDNGQVIGHGYSICSNIEPNKVKWQEYAIASMAQTRAASRAYRNTIGFIMKLMGNEFMATPAEEMDTIPQSDPTDIASKVAREMAQRLDDTIQKSSKITETEATAIRTALEDIDSPPDFPAFCQRLGIARVEDLSAALLPQARKVVTVLRKEAKEAKKESEGK